MIEYIEDKNEKFSVMKTECDHFFHTKCLIVWMNSKL